MIDDTRVVSESLTLCRPSVSRALGHQVIRFLLVGLLIGLPASHAVAETSRLAFVSEYVRELGLNERMRALGGRFMMENSERGVYVRALIPGAGQRERINA